MIGRGSSATATNHAALIKVILLILLALVILRTAWVSDDAYISFRSVYNIAHGYGPVWNTTERVQAFTNPLWVIFLAMLMRFTGEIYFTAIVASLVASVTAVAIVGFRLSRDIATATLALTVLILSKAFIDYCTSGLENPAAYLIMACFAVVFYGRGKRTRRFALLCAIAAIGAVNRMDNILLYGPPIVVAFWEIRSLKAIGLGFLAFSPLWLWESFSVGYYGFPFPNTYYAKMHAGIPLSERLMQGLAYYMEALAIDPLTLLAIAAAIAIVVVQRRRQEYALVVGLAIYMLYTVRVGGDFMAGRYFAVPLFLSAIMIARTNLPPSGVGRFVPLAVVLLVGLSVSRCPVYSDETYGTHNENGINHRGIADERGWYYQDTGLLRMNRTGAPVVNHKWYREGIRDRAMSDQVVAASCVGFYGYAIGPEKHVIDGYGLSEPLLARLPMCTKPDWRIGHFSRYLPYGYRKTILDDENHIADSGLAVYYDKLETIVRGRLFTRERWLHILKMNLGLYDHLLDHWSWPEPAMMTYAEVATPIEVPSSWNDEGHLVLDRGGVIVAMDRVYNNKRIEISVDHNDYYIVSFLRDSAVIDWLRITRKPPPAGGMRVDTLDVPQWAYEAGYDCITVQPESGDDLFSMGHLKVLP